MKSKSLTTLHLIPLALAAGLIVSVAAANASTEKPTAPSTVKLSLASWNSPVLMGPALSASDEPPFLAQGGDPLEGGNPVDVYGFKRKSPARAFLQSFLIPGWGQLYAKSSFWKPILFVGIEAAGWGGYASFHGNGVDKEKEFKKFADVHWDSTKYVEGLYATFYSHDYSPSVKNAWLDTTTYFITVNDTLHTRSLSHHAWYKEDGARVQPDEYYENVGKYNQFTFGWDDFPALESDSFPENSLDSTRLGYVSPHRNSYLHMRDDANSEYNKANTFLVATVANHLLAGFWAALDARAYNRTQDQFGQIESKLRLVRSPENPKKLMPYLTIGYKF